MKSAFLLSLAAAACIVVLPSANASEITVQGQGLSFTYDPDNFVIGPNQAASDVRYIQNTLWSEAGGASGPGDSATGSSVTFYMHLTQRGERFSDAFLTEHGSYALSGPNSSVSMAGSSFTISAIGGTASTQNAIVPSAPIADNDGVMHPWVAVANDDLSSAQWADATGIRITVTNLLTAHAQAGSTALIGAGFGGASAAADNVSVGLSPTPLPPSAPMFAGALAVFALLTWSARRRAGRHI